MNQENIIHNEEGKQSVENNRNTPDDSMLTVTVTSLTVPAALPNPGPANRSGPEGRRWASWGCHVSPLVSRDNEKRSGRSRMRERQKTVRDPDSSHLSPQPHPQKPHHKTSAEGRPQHFVSRWMSVTSGDRGRPWSGTPSRRCGEDYTLFPVEDAVWGPTRGVLGDQRLL